MAEIAPELLQKIKVILETVGDKEAISSLKDLTTKLKELKQQPISAVAGEMQKVRQAISDINKETKAINTPFDQLLKSNQQMSNAVLNMNYVIRDSPYFMRNFGMGVMAIGNNLNPLIDSLIRAKQAAAETGTTLGSALMNSLKGVTGIMFFASIAVAAFQAITFAMESAKSKAEKLSAEYWGLSEKTLELRKRTDELESVIKELDYEGRARAVAQLTGEIASLTRETIRYNINILLTKQFLDAIPQSSSWGLIANLLEGWGDRTEDVIKAYERLNALLGTTFSEGIARIAETKSGIALKKWNEELGRGKVALETTKDALIKIRESGQLTEKQWEANTKAIQNLNAALKLYDVEIDKEPKEPKEPKDSFVLEKLQAEFERDRMVALKKLQEMREDYNIKAITDEEEREIASFKKTLRDKQIELGDYFTSCIIDEEEYLSNIGLINEDAARAIEDIKKKWFRKRLAEQLSEEEKAQRELLQQQREQLQIQRDQVSAALQLVSALGQLGGTADNTLQKFAAMLQMILTIKATVDAMNVGKEAGGIDQLTGILGIFGALFGFIGKVMHQGGVVKAHGGYLAKDEVPIIAQKGEMILTPYQQSNLFNQLQKGGGGTQKVYLMVDGRVIMQALEPYLPNAINRMRRVR